MAFLTYLTPTPPTNGTNDVQTLTFGGTITGGTVQLQINGAMSAAASWNSTTGTLVANLQAVIDTLLNGGVASGANCVVANSTLSSGIGNVTITFQGTYANAPQNIILVVSSLTGTLPTATIAHTTLGVYATERGAQAGQNCVWSKVAGVGGPGSNNTVQTITLGGTPTGGSFTLTSGLFTSAAINWSATTNTIVANVQTALDTMFSAGLATTTNAIATAGTITSGIGTILVTFQGYLQTSAQQPMTSTSSLTGTAPTLAVTLTTTGGTTTQTGALPVQYVNNSITPFSPTWAQSGQVQSVNLGAPALGSGLSILAGHADTGSDQTFTTFVHQPDVARTFVSTPSGTTANVTAVQDIVTGTDAWGNVITEILPAYTAGQATAVTSVNAFLTITKYVQKANGASVTITVTGGPKIGLNTILTNDSCVTGFKAGVREATRPVIVPNALIMSKNLISFTSALDGSSAFIAEYVTN